MSHEELVEFIWTQLDEIGSYEDEDIAVLVAPDGVTDEEWDAAVAEIRQAFE